MVLQPLPLWATNNSRPRAPTCPVNLPVPRGSPTRLSRQGLDPISHRCAPPPFLRHLKRGGPTAEQILPWRGTAVVPAPSTAVFLGLLFFSSQGIWGSFALLFGPRRCWSSRPFRRAAPARFEASSGGAAGPSHGRAAGVSAAGAPCLPPSPPGAWGACCLCYCCSASASRAGALQVNVSSPRAGPPPPSVPGGPERGGPEHRLGAKVLLAPQHPPGSRGDVALPRHGGCISALPVGTAEARFFFSAAPTLRGAPVSLSVRGSRGVAGILSRCPPAPGCWAAAGGLSRIGDQPSRSLSSFSFAYRRVY